MNSRINTVPVKSLDTPSHSIVFVYFCSTLQINTEDIKTMKEHIWNYLVNKKVLKNPEYDFYFIFFKVAPFCLDDSFAHSWLHEVVTWNGFQLTRVPCQESICGITSLLNVFETISCVVQRYSRVSAQWRALFDYCCNP